jgi:hypothetical protein
MVSAEHEDINEPLQKRGARTPPTKFMSLVPPSPKGDEEIKATIKGCIPHLQTIINAYLRNDVRLPLWQAQHGSDEMRSHIANLKMPAATSPSPFPSLLLHNLGQLSHDPLLPDRVDRLFRPQSNLRYSFPYLHAEICL